MALPKHIAKKILYNAHEERMRMEREDNIIDEPSLDDLLKQEILEGKFPKASAEERKAFQEILKEMKYKENAPQKETASTDNNELIKEFPEIPEHQDL